VAFWTRPAEGKFSWKKILIATGLAAVFFLLVMR